jgi:rfaE bifunctional protein kinase chain/domain/rfaE bifunctional protein nucleotidyltransferase chain/domain
MSFDELAAHLSTARRGRTVVLCHGVFDLLHIGHIKHLQAARALGDILVVTLTPDHWVNKGPDRPAFAQALRAEALAALGCVDYVAVNLWPKAVETIQQLRPDIFAKGADYQNRASDHSGHLSEEEQAIASVGGQLVITPGQVFSSSTLINRHLSDLPSDTRDYLAGFARRHPIGAIAQALNAAAKLKVLVVGDAIIDQYDYCQAIGKSSKEPVLAVKALSQETFIGGILAVANHVATFAPATRLLTTLGQGESRQAFIDEHLARSITREYLHWPARPTIVKQRYIDSYFFQKLFEVYRLDDALPGEDYDAAITAAIERLAPQADLVIAVDFGHHTLTDNAIAALAANAKFLAVNAQSNAGNLGYHAISKYPRADLVCVAENEMRLEARDRHGCLEAMVQRVSEKLACPNVIVTRGSHGCLTYNQNDGFCHIPAVAGQVKDRMGAGDTFLAAAALAIAAGLPMEAAGLVGNAAGAQAVATVGHRRFLDRVGLIKHVECLLK